MADTPAAKLGEKSATTPSTKRPSDSEDSQDLPIGLITPPGLRGARPWDGWDQDEEGPTSPLNKGMIPESAAPCPPPGLDTGLQGVLADMAAAHGGYDVSMQPWVLPFEVPGQQKLPMMQVTSLTNEEDWKKMFDPSLVADFEQQDGSQLAEDHPAYVKTGTEPTGLLSENEMLAAENARLAMENELLKSKYMNASWSNGMQAADMSPASGYWSGPCSPEMSPEMYGMNPFFPYGYPMMPPSQMAMWHWQAEAAKQATKQSGRARTDSDIAGPRQRSGSVSDMGRGRALSDINDLRVPGEEFCPADYTTVMLRNLPNNYSRAMLLKLIDTEGFGGQYDFIYLPMDFKSHASLGYAFVNLVDSEEATRFFETFEGFHRWVVPSQKVCSVNWSHPYQGLEAHIERYRNSPVMHEDVPDDYKPMVFNGTERIVFPPPTKKLKVPRMRPGHEKTLLEGGEEESDL